MKNHGYAGKILRVNLSNCKTKFEETTRYTKWVLGGKGVNQWLLYKEVKPGIESLDPANKIFFGAGVLTGTLIPGSCRYNVDSKNVLTGGVGAANAGGHFGPELKYAGYDHIIIQGRSRVPCYLWIDDDSVEVRSAKSIWGKTTWETDDMIREELGDEDIQIASIGQAGENLVRSACIINNGGRATERCGLGAVMGSKNLKAIAVRGSGEILVPKPDEFMELLDEIWNKQVELAESSNDIKYGFVEMRNKYSGNQVRNFQDGFWDPDKVRNTSGEKLSVYKERRLACFACPSPRANSMNWLKVTEGEFKGIEGEGYYTNTRRNYGVKLDIDNIEGIIKAHLLCNQYGLDVDNAAGPIAWAMECYQKGILTDEDTEGLELEWGNYQAVLELLRKIAFREGFGEILGEGCKRASEMIGRESEKYCMHIKGQDLYENIRTTIGYGVGTILAPRGGAHLDGAIFTEDPRAGINSPEVSMELYGVPTAGDRKAYAGKAKLIILQENLNAIYNCLGICTMVTGYLTNGLTGPLLSTFDDLAKIYTAATGQDMTSSELIRIGDRINNVMKAFNVREGMSRSEDYPPDRFFDEPIKSGGGKGEHLDRDKYDRLLDDYYRLREWDVETGLPTQRKLEELELTEVEKELRKMGKLKRPYYL
jgi:aldehyde:ferredoxin oxidoreductase